MPFDPGLPNPSGIPLECGDCGAHFQIDPSGDIAGASCSECGGKRFFRSQPSSTGSPGTLRDMVDSDSQIDQGGNPLGEGTIMGNDGENGRGFRDNYMHSKVAVQHTVPCPHCGSPTDKQPWEINLHCRSCGQITPNIGWDDPESWAEQGTDLNSLWPDMVTSPDRSPEYVDPTGKNFGPPHQGKVAYPQEPPMMYEPMPGGIAPNMSLQQWRQDPGRHVCPTCGEDYSNDPLGFSHHLQVAHPEFGLNNGEFTVAKRVEHMRTLNMEPYPPLWDESYIKTAGPLALAPEAIGLGADALGAGEAAGGAGGLLEGAKGLLDAVPQPIRSGIGTLMKGVFGQGQQAGGMAPVMPTPTPAPTIEALGSTDIPFLLMADLETPHSVKSVDEQHDDPEHQDQQEFNVGDKSPTNPQNPNNEDSGTDGEDGVKDATPGYGFGEQSPGLDRAMMLLPLLLHYFDSEESGEHDPLIRGLHDLLDQENPGYMDQEDPNGHQAVQLLVQNHKSPHQAGANAMGMGGMGMGMGNGMGNGMGSGPGICPSCGGPLAADGSCPTCGKKSGLGGGQYGAQPLTGGGTSLPSGGGMSGGPSYPPNRVGTSGAGPQTPEQKAAVIQLLEQQGRHGDVPMVELEPWRFAKELAEIQGQPNVAPLVDPNQAQPQMPPQGMMNPPGAMPVNDPSQPGGGGGQPMQPMAAFKQAGTCNMCGSHEIKSIGGGLFECKKCGNQGTDESSFGQKEADANNAVPRCPKCHSASTSVHSLGDNTTDGTQGYYARCHACDNQWQVGKSARVILAELGNPMKGESTMTWTDNQGRPLMVGQTYELRSPNYPVPDEIKIISKKPDELGVKLVGDIAGIQASHDNDNFPDFTLTPQQVQSSNYEFVPSNEAPSQPQGGMPGMEQIPQAPPTTDEISTSYPNRGTVSSYDDNDDMSTNDDICHKCGNTWITHTASSSTQTMHECARCGAAWETKDNFMGREANADLEWLNQDSSDDFAAEMERFQERRGSQGRDIRAIAAGDDHYQAVKHVLNQNKMQREAGRHFTPGEQRELINERGKARNLGLLDIEDTHYSTQFLPPTANEMNVPDGHLLLGL